MDMNQTGGNSLFPENNTNEPNRSPSQPQAQENVSASQTASQPQESINEPQTASQPQESMNAPQTPTGTDSFAGNAAAQAGQSVNSAPYTGNMYASQPGQNANHPWQSPGANGYPYGQNAYPYGNPAYQKPKKTKKPKQEHPFAKKLGRTAAIAVVFGLCAGVVFRGVDAAADRLFPDSSSGSVNNTVVTQSSGTQEAMYDASEVVANVMPAMVAIDITATQTVQNPFTFFGYGSSYEQQVTGSGTGIIISEDDSNLYMVTNHHVIEGADSITVTFVDGSAVSGAVRGSDEDSDLAVVAVSLSEMSEETKKSIKIAVMGDSDKVQLGEPAIAIGNALGYGQSVTVGHISVLAKEVQLTDKTMNLLQTDAAINPGNSGGALLNGEGEVIGINSVKYASTDVEGIGYAIPVNDAIPIINAMVNGTALPESQKPYLGISGTDVTEQYQERFGLPEGVYVSSVTAGSPAAEGGMQPYDIIVSFDGQEIKTMDQLTEALNKKAAGDTVTIVVKRHNENMYSDVTLTVTLDSVSNAPDDEQQTPEEESYYSDDFGNYGDFGGWLH